MGLLNDSGKIVGTLPATLLDYLQYFTCAEPSLFDYSSHYINFSIPLIRVFTEFMAVSCLQLTEKGCRVMQDICVRVSKYTVYQFFHVHMTHFLNM